MDLKFSSLDEVGKAVFSEELDQCTKATWVHPPLDLVNFDK